MTTIIELTMKNSNKNGTEGDNPVISYVDKLNDKTASLIYAYRRKVAIMFMNEKDAFILRMLFADIIIDDETRIRHSYD